MEGKEYYKVIGDNEKQKETAYQDLQEVLDTKSPSLAKHELEKTAKEIEIINLTQGIADEMIRGYGGDPKSVPLDHVYVLDDVNKVTEGRLEKGVHHPLELTVGIERSASSLIFASTIAHELFHSKSFKSVRVDRKDRIRLYRSGLSMVDRKDETKEHGREKEYFGDMEEAIVAECTRIFMDKLENKEQFKDEIEAINRLKEWIAQSYRRGDVPEEKISILENEIKYIPMAQEKVKDIMTSYENENERSAMAAGMFSKLLEQGDVERVERYVEREKLYKLLDRIIENSEGKFKNRDGIFGEFAKANFTGNYLPLARTVEGILGKGSFRKLAEEFSRKSSEKK